MLFFCFQFITLWQRESLENGFPSAIYWEIDKLDCNKIDTVRQEPVMDLEEKSNGIIEADEEHINIYFIVGHRKEIASFRPDQVTNRELKGEASIANVCIRQF